jgi:C-terminal processing protease CtpA/Prc
MVLHSGTPIGRILAPTEYNAYLRKLNKESPSMEEAAAYAADRINALPSHVLPQAYAGELAVLIDRHTHGAGELVAAAIQHSLRGTVLGEATDGYGYETRRARLSDGWALDYPVALVFGPKGEPREGQSVVPDISIPPAQLGDPASLWPVLREFGTPLSGNSEF